MKKYVSYYKAPFGLLKICANEAAILQLNLFYKYGFKEENGFVVFQKEELLETQIREALEKEIEKEREYKKSAKKKNDIKNETMMKENAIIKEAKRQLDEYFDGKRETFDLLLEPQGTVFQEKVWNALTEIPYGEIRSYKQIATHIENPKAMRAIGGANHNNPIFIIIPCHRVIGADGSMVGYGGGIEVKKYLLELEGYIS